MIDLAIQHLAAHLNQALRRNLQVAEDLVVACSVLDQDGSTATHAANKLAVFLVNIEQDRLAYTPGSHPASTVARIATTAAPLHLNLLVMFAANFGSGNYQEALKLIAYTAQHFQSHPLHDHQSAPDLDPRLERLILELETLSTADLSNLWGVLGGRYLPSVLYRVRMLSMATTQLTSQQERIGRPQLSLRAPR